MTVLDPRLNAYRDDLADRRLAGRVEAARFAEGRPASVIAPVADVRGSPAAASGLQTQFLLGERVTVFDEHEGWAWVQGARDGYVGYAETAALGQASPAATHRVSAPRTFRYIAPDMKLPVAEGLSLGSEVAVTGFAETRGTRYALTAGGAIVANHLAPLADHAADYVAVAETLINTPYLWGGASGFGIDCSGLVQLAMRMAGRDAPRDSDMQAVGLGDAIDRAEGLRRGDLVFWKGHVAIMTSPETVIHANGATMMVSAEGLDEAVERNARLYGMPTGYRRV